MASPAGATPPAGLPSFPFPPDLLGILVQGKAVGYTNVAFLVRFQEPKVKEAYDRLTYWVKMLLVYDHLLTFSTEIATVWTLPWGLPKFMFMINRYIVPPMLFFDGITPSLKLGEEICHFITRWTAWPTLLSLSAVDIILLIRVSAIYGNKKIIVWGLYGFYVLTLIPFLVMAIMVSLHTTALPTKGTPFTDCLFSAPPYYYAAWIPPTLFESVLIFLTLIRTVRFDKVNPTLRVLARDSMIYFSIIFALLLANTFIAKFGKGFIGAALIVPCSVTACIAAARMMMNIRMMVPEIAQELTHISTQNIQFKHADPGSLVESGGSGETGTTAVSSSENTAR